MATMMAASTVALPVAGRNSNSFVTVRAAKLSGQAPSSGGPIRCNAGENRGEQLCADVAQKGPSFRLSAVMVPILAAAVVGGVQPPVQASEWDRFLTPVDMETSSTDEPYKDLLEKMKERRAAREKKSTPVQAEEKKSVEEPKTFSSYFSPPPVENKSPPVQAEEKKSVEEPKSFSSFFSPPPVEKKSPPVQAEEKKSVEEENPFSSFFSSPPVYTPPAPPAPPPVEKAAPAPAVFKPSPAAEIAPVVAAESERTHGFLPLFLAQFLFLVATIGGGFIAITTPDSKWKDLRKTADGFVSKATPVVEDSWTKVKPVAAQAQEKASQVAEAAKPYVTKAWEVAQPLAVKTFEAAKPLAKKAFEASKPILKGAQTKAVELFQQATSSKQ